ncbi:glycoprotein repeat domain-containing protein [Microcystis phage Mwe-JY08]
MPDNITVKDANGENQVMRTREVAGVHTSIQRIEGYDPVDDMVKVKSVQKKFRDSFVGSTLNSAKWESTLGTGGAITVGSGVLTLGSGTTANSQTSVITIDTFTIPFRVNIGLTLSQRIANQTFIVEAISVDPVTLAPDGLHVIGFLFDGTTATQGKYRVQNSGAAPLDSGAVTFPTTASAGFYEIEPFADEAWFHGGTLDSTTGRANSYRRHQQIPDPNAVFKIRLRWLNGATPPASNTNAVIQYISVQDYAELTAEITGGRGQSVAGQALGVSIASGNVGITGTLPAIVGQTAHDGAVTGSPVRVGGRAVTALFTAVATGDATDLIADTRGRLITKEGAPRELTDIQATTISTTTETTIVTAGAAGIFNDVQSFILSNTSATGVRVDIRDATAGTIRISVWLPPNSTETISLPVPARQAIAANNWTAQLSAAVTDVRITAISVRA